MRAQTNVSTEALPMAYDRKTFKERVTEKIDGALEEFYTARLAELNGQKKWVEHWLAEVDRLLFLELRRVLRRPIKGRWDRRKAVSEVIQELRHVDAAYRRSVAKDVLEYYGMKKLKKPLPPEVTDEFYALVERAVNQSSTLREPTEEAE